MQLWTCRILSISANYSGRGSKDRSSLLSRSRKDSSLTPTFFSVQGSVMVHPLSTGLHSGLHLHYTQLRRMKGTEMSDEILGDGYSIDLRDSTLMISSLGLTRVYHFIRMVMAMARQANPTYGDNRSPIRAALNRRPEKPVFSLSTREGATARTYVHVQMKRRMTRSSD